MPNRLMRIFLLGATGTIGRATARALLAEGHDVVCFLRPQAKRSSDGDDNFTGADLRYGDVSSVGSLSRDGFHGEKFDAIISCLASRTGAPKDAWAIDHAAHIAILDAAKTAGISQMVLLSAICVQKPQLAFQHAKLAFEQALIESGLIYSIVRPTAYFKSLSGQVERVRKGKPFLLFGTGELTACKPISDDDLGRYIAGCLTDQSRHNQILPIAGPGDAITPKQQGEKLFALLGREPKFTHVPVGVLDVLVRFLGTIGRVLPTIADKAELARIGRYYATESMLVWDPETQQYDSEATPSTGSETLFEHYENLIKDDATVERGDHSVF